MARELAFHPDAVVELEAAADWYFERNSRIGTEFLREVEEAVETIISAPERWTSSVAGTRRILLQRFPFAIVYRITQSTIQIVAIAHGRRRPGYWRHRL